MFRFSQSVAFSFFFAVVTTNVYGQPDIQTDVVRMDDMFLGLAPGIGEGEEMLYFPVDFDELLTVAIVQEQIYSGSRQIGFEEIPLGDSYLGFAEIGGHIPYSIGWAEIRRIEGSNLRNSLDILSSAESLETFWPRADDVGGSDVGKRTENVSFLLAWEPSGGEIAVSGLRRARPTCRILGSA